MARSKSMRRKGPSVDPSTLDRSGFISRETIEGFMVERLRRPGEGYKQARERIRDNLDYAVTVAKNRRLPPPSEQGWQVGVIGAYLRKCHPGEFEDFPADRCVVGHLDAAWQKHPRDASDLPNNLAECHATILDNWREIAELQRANAALMSQLLPFVRADTEFRQNQSIAGKKARGIQKGEK